MLLQAQIAQFNPALSTQMIVLGARPAHTPAALDTSHDIVTRPRSSLDCQKPQYTTLGSSLLPACAVKVEGYDRYV